MKTNLLPLVRKYHCEYSNGKYKSGYIHVGSSRREIIRQCFTRIHATHRTRRAQNAKGQTLKPARQAFYLGAIAGVRHHLRLCKAFNL